MWMRNPLRFYKTSPDVVRLAVMMYIRFPLSLRQVEDLLHERGIDVSYETVREISKKRDREAALKFLRKAMKRYGNPHEDVTDRLRSYRAAMKVIGNDARQQTER